MTTLTRSSAPIAARTLVPATSRVRARLTAAGLAIWNALEAFGYARARRDLAQVAERYERTSPEVARQLRQLDR